MRGRGISYYFVKDYQNNRTVFGASAADSKKHTYLSKNSGTSIALVSPKKLAGVWIKKKNWQESSLMP